MDYKIGVPQDRYINNKEKYQNKKEVFGVEYVPVNMHNRPVPNGKGDESAKNVIKSINKQMGNC